MSEKFEAVADRWLDVVLRGSSEWMCACIACPGEQSLQFNIRKGLWICFRCGEKGTAKSLVERLGGSFTNPALGVDAVQEALDSLRKELRMKRKGEPERNHLSESYLARYGGKPHEYWTQRRNFTRETISKWDLGYDAVGPRVWDGDGWVAVGPSVTLPYRNPDGELLGVFHRRLDDGFPRYVYPKGFDRTGSLFGSWNLGDAGIHDGRPSPGRVTGGRGLVRAVLVEGSTDTMRIHQTGFRTAGQYGSSLHRDQVRLLRLQGINEIVLFYDYDASGIKATRQAAQVLDGFLVRSVEWDTELYCWHGKLCDCGMKHKALDLGFCKKKRKCRCGRMHDVDPGDWKRLPDSTVIQMVEEAPLVGRTPWQSDSRSGRKSYRPRNTAPQSAVRRRRRAD